eukprot:TRINITY_DN20933_c0_g2_i1.p1 TRINITY_DN20933_c0_g2~~TRINITY_DN20933_c0_g2_i1.p1  ORF type:complete len:3701 (+),score=333.29 TRINITY_DN20933_c0_g2_i1:157-11103(+)
MVSPGFGELVLCQSDSLSGACAESVRIPSANVLYLGRFVIASPTQHLDDGFHYRLLLKDTVIKHFKGAGMNSTSSFTVAPASKASDASSLAPPQLIAQRVDCNGNLRLSDNDGVSDVCDADGDGRPDYIELTALTTNSTPMLRGAQFHLYFSEPVVVAAGASAQLMKDGDVESPTVSVPILTNRGSRAGVVKMAPELESGWLYTLKLESGVLVDSLTQSRQCASTSFTFYTPLVEPAILPINGAVDVARTTAIKLSFPGSIPRLGLQELVDGKFGLHVVLEAANSESRHIPLADRTQVRFQGSDVLIVADPPLEAGRNYTVIVPSQSIRYMTKTLSWHFSTSSGDDVAPRVVHYGVEGGWPYVLFSEAVRSVSGKSIKFLQNGSIKYSIRADDASCGLGGAANHACVQIDAWRKKLTMYPMGKRESTLNVSSIEAWAAAYDVDAIQFERGAYSDVHDAGANFMDKWQLDIASVDSRRPALVDRRPARTNEIDITTTHAAFIFDEPVLAGTNYPFIKVTSVSLAGPQLVTARASASPGSVVTLRFDMAVQAGSGDFSVYPSSTNENEVELIPIEQCWFAGNYVFLAPRGPLDESDECRVVSSSAEVVKNNDGVAMQDSVDTNISVITTAYPESGPVVLHNTLHEYACLPPTSLPDIILYTDRELASVDGNVSLLACGMGSCSNDESVEVWTLHASQASETERPELVAHIDVRRKFATSLKLSGSPKPSSPAVALELGPWYVLRLGAGLMVDRHAGLSNAVDVRFAMCDVAFSNPPDPEVRVFPPAGFLRAHSGGRRFEAVLPSDAVNDVFGNSAAASSFHFGPELTLPSLVEDLSEPRELANPQANVVLAFSEVVQAGSGFFTFWTTNDDSAPQFIVDVAAVASFNDGAGGLFSGHKVFITPRLFCKNSQTCNDFSVGNTYYVRTSAPGVVRDSVGNSLPQLNTRGRWEFTIVPASARLPPKVILTNDVSFDARSRNLNGRIYFSHPIEHKLGALRLNLCVSGEACDTIADVRTDVDVDFSFDELSDNLNGSDYGVVGFHSVVPFAGRLYQLSVPPAFGQDSGLNIGPQAPYRFQFNVSSGESVSTPFLGILRREPVNATTLSRGNLTFVIDFSERIRRGEGSISVCANADADAMGVHACVPLTFADGSNASALDGITCSVRGRRATIELSGELRRGQRAHIVLGEGAFYDARGSRYGKSEIIEGSDYFVSIVGDTVSPFLYSYVAPADVSGSLSLFFSEAISRRSTEVIVEDSSGNPLPNASVSIDKQMMHISGLWNASSEYRLRSLSRSLFDLAGNAVRGDSYLLPDLIRNAWFVVVPDPGPSDFSCPRRLFASQQVATGEAVNVSDEVQLNVSLDITTTTGVTTTATTITTSTTSTTSTTITTTTTTEPFDCQPPRLVSMFPPAFSSDLPPGATNFTILWYFDEQVRLAEQAAISFVDRNGMERGRAEHLELVYRNGVKAIVPPAVLVPGSTFWVSVQRNAVLDRAGNAAEPFARQLSCEPANFSLIPSSVSFTVPLRRQMQLKEVNVNSTMLPVSGSLIHRYNVFALKFDTLVQSGGGTVALVGSDPADCRGLFCSTNEVFSEVLATSLPMVYSVQNGTRTSTVIFDPRLALTPDRRYTLRISLNAFADSHGRHVDGVLADTYTVTSLLRKDDDAPFVVSASLGRGGSPNPAFDDDFITLFFSEAIQRGSKGVVKLVPSNGASFCSAGADSCLAGQACKGPCGYKAADAIVTFSVLSIDGCRVDLKVGALQERAGYALVVDEGAFQDIAGNPNVALNGEMIEAGYVLRAASTRRETRVVYRWPEAGSRFVSPSSVVRVIYSDAVQAGSGNISFGEQIMPSTSCLFYQRSMSCSPPSNFVQSEIVKVSVGPEAVVTGSFQAVEPIEWTFTVIGLDHSPPVLNEHDIVFEQSRGMRSLITLEFSEVVQLGEGTIILADCSPGHPDRCYDGSTEQVPDRLDMKLSTSNDDPSLRLYFQGKRVYIDHKDLQSDRLYTLRTYSSGLFLDKAGHALPQLNGRSELKVKDSVDRMDPALYMSYPTNDAAPSSDILLFFSEAVQSSSIPKLIRVSDGISTSDIATDNSKPLQGRVLIHGNRVSIDPFVEMHYDRTVTVTVPYGAFIDLFGLPFAGVTRQFRTSSLMMTSLRRSGSANGFPKQEKASLLHSRNMFVLFSGRQAGQCLGDVWHSQNGSAWFKLMASDMPRPATAGAAIVADAHECFWLVGGTCSIGVGAFWKSCDLGKTWTRLPAPVSVPVSASVTVPFPALWDGHAAVIVGGWQLVVVSAVKNANADGVWTFLDEKAAYVQRVLSGELPFGYRRDPSLSSSSDGSIYLVGGYSCSGDHCEKVGHTLTDIWTSKDLGTSWTCLSASYATTIGRSVPDGLRHMSAIMMHDDSILLVGSLDDDAQSDHVYSSVHLASDSVFDSAVHMQLPSNQPVSIADMSYTVYFRESVQKGSTPIRFLDLGSDGAVGGVGAAEDTQVDDFSVEIHGQRMTVSPQSLTHGRSYRIEIPAGSLEDSAGNVLQEDLPRYAFTVDSDYVPPSVSKVLPSGDDVSPNSCLSITMNKEVVPGSGALSLAPTEGKRVDLPISEAVIVGNKVLFPSLLRTTLRTGMEYRVLVPPGLLFDMAGNAMIPSSTHRFSTRFSDQRDIVPPMLLATNPYFGQRNVRGYRTSITLYFDEPIKIGKGSIILRHEDAWEQPLEFPVTHEQVNVSGSELTLTVSRGTLNMRGLYKLEVTSGAILDSVGNPFAGLGTSETLYFETLQSDDVSPTFDQHPWPPHEPVPTFELPQSTTILLTFNENVQAGPPSSDAVVRLIPAYTRVPIEIPARDAIIAERKVVLIPPRGLLAGELYLLKIGASAFMDVDGNFFREAESVREHRFSVAGNIGFRKLGAGAWSFQDDKDKGTRARRFVAGVTLDSKNRVYVVPGRPYVSTGSGVGDNLGSELEWLDELWAFSTGREQNCATAIGEPGPCSLKKCQHDRDGVATLGTRKMRRVVWQEPSAGGRFCYGADNKPFFAKGQLVESFSETCPCPQCGLPPEPPWPGQMLDFNLQAPTLPVSALGGTRPLQCISGYEAIDEFKCVVENDFLGRFARPYPKCTEARCTTAPSLTSVDHAVAFMSQTCASVTKETPVQHGVSCPIRCAPGFSETGGGFRCVRGTFLAPRCTRKRCKTSSPPNLVLKGGSNDPEGLLFESSAVGACSPGFQLWTGPLNAGAILTKADSVELICSMLDKKKPDDQPVLVGKGVKVECRRLNCGSFSNAGDGALIRYPEGTLFEATANIQCASGFKLVSDEPLVCAAKQLEVGTDVEWQQGGRTAGTLCVRVQCTPPTDPHGKYTYKGGEGATQTWRLQCDDGYTSYDGLEAKCSDSGQLTRPKPCTFVGGCPLVGSAAEKNSDCPSWIHEGKTCNLKCSDGVPVGVFKCLVMELVGSPTCADEAMQAKAVKVKKLAGSFALSAWVPLGLQVDSESFRNAVSGSLAAAAGAFVQDLTRVAITEQSSQTGSSRRLRAVAGPALRSMNMKVSYELQVQNAEQPDQIAGALRNVASTSSQEGMLFMKLMTYQGAQVIDLKTLRNPAPFEDVVLAPETKLRPEAIAAVRQYLAPDAFVLGKAKLLMGFFGALSIFFALTCLALKVRCPRRVRICCRWCRCM